MDGAVRCVCVCVSQCVCVCVWVGVGVCSLPLFPPFPLLSPGVSAVEGVKSGANVSKVVLMCQKWC